MKIQDIPVGSVIVGLDGSDHSRRALAWAVGAAERERRPLALVHACVPMSPSYGYASGGLPVDWAEVNRAATRDALASLHLEAEGVRGRHRDLRVLEVIDTLDPRVGLTVATHRAHVLVLGSRGRGPVATVLLGSVSVAVTRHAACPVVVVRPGDEPEPDAPVVAAVDGTAASLPVLELAFRTAAELDTSVRVVHCLWALVPAGPDVEDDARLTVAEAMAGLAEKYPDTPVQVDIIEGGGSAAIVEAARDAALLVLGHLPARGLRRTLYASVAIGALEHATCPVAVVPGPADSMSIGRQQMGTAT
ncbi:universal stress protein [Nocardioides plantarum]|uniref:Universal stress protein n=1 Tax=Nocardioides plantarum TaxID=29299 RepID=A0ABV5K7I9_9ACTN|nr:universal stress protein [Nocardioides plantarum]